MSVGQFHPLHFVQTEKDDSFEWAGKLSLLSSELGRRKKKRQ